MFEFSDKKSAVALVKYERDRSKVVYADYIAGNGVTLDTVKDHVQALAALAFPGYDQKTADDASKRERKAFCTRVRNGLNYTLGKEAAKRKPPTPKTPAEVIRESLVTAQEAGMTRAEILAIVADVVDVTPVQVAA